jgi:hypothetical protein
VVRKWYLNGNLSDKKEVTMQTSGERTFWTEGTAFVRPQGGSVFEKQKYRCHDQCTMKEGNMKQVEVRGDGRARPHQVLWAVVRSLGKVNWGSHCLLS